VDGTKLPRPFDRIQCADLIGWTGDLDARDWKKVVASVAELIGGAAAPPTPGAAATPPAARKLSICVLPFANMSGDPEQEYFSDGISEDIITDLSKVSALSVVARNTAFGFKGKSPNVKEVAHQLGVSHVLEGSVRKAGNRVRITAQLIDGKAGDHLWAERWDRDLTDIFALQDEISEAVVGALKLKLLPEEKAAIERRGTDNVDAYNLYLMAREILSAGNGGDPRREESIIRLTERATEIDPGFARAWAMMSWGQANLAFDRGLGGDGGLAAAERAQALDPSLGLPHAVKAKGLYEGGDREAAFKGIDRALELEPESFEVCRIAGIIYYRERRFEQAARLFERVAEAVPSEVAAPGMLVSIYQALGDQAKARKAAHRAVACAEAALAQDRSHGYAMGLGVLALATLGETDRAKQWINRALLIDPDNLLARYNFACALSGMLGDVEGAIELMALVLRRCARPLIKGAATDPDLQPIRGDPRFQTMLAEAEARLAAASDGGGA
jgi:adenylate cyclase